MIAPWLLVVSLYGVAPVMIPQRSERLCLENAAKMEKVLRTGWNVSQLMCVPTGYPDSVAQ